MRRFIPVFLLLGACAPATTTEPAPAPRLTPAPQVAVSKASPLLAYERPSHPGRLDPFAPMRWAKEAPRVRKMGPLERTPLSGLKLIGIISEVAAPRAMFVTPDGVGHLAYEGDRVQGGVIEDIRNHEVEVQTSTGERVLTLHGGSRRP